MARRRPHLNEAITALLEDVRVRMPEFAHVRPGRVLVVAGEARRASRGTVKPLTFAGGIISGQGNDCRGMFGIAGCYDAGEGEILLTKTYYRADRVRFRGFIDGCAIWGTWEIKGAAKGGFHIWPWGEMVEHEGDARELRPATAVPGRKLRS